MPVRCYVCVYRAEFIVHLLVHLVDELHLVRDDGERIHEIYPERLLHRVFVVCLHAVLLKDWNVEHGEILVSWYVEITPVYISLLRVVLPRHRLEIHDDVPVVVRLLPCLRVFAQPLRRVQLIRRNPLTLVDQVYLLVQPFEHLIVDIRIFYRKRERRPVLKNNL